MSFSRKSSMAINTQVSTMGMMNAEYAEALNTLSDNTMTKAYDKLDDPGDGTNPTTELCRILDSCKKAATVILSEAPTPNLPIGGSIIGAAPPASRIAPRAMGLLTKKNLLPPPNRRISTIPMPRLNNINVTTKRMKVEQPRPKSEAAASSFKGTGTTTTTTMEQQPSSSSPPPNAMQFLAKLNKSATTASNRKAKLKNSVPKRTTAEATEVSVMPPLPAIDEEEKQGHEHEEDEEHEEEEEEEMDIEIEEEEEDEEEDEDLAEDEDLEEDEDPKPRRTRRQPPRRLSVPTAPPMTTPSRKQPSRSSKR